MDKQITNLNSTYTTWIVYLIAEICESEKLIPHEIAINEEEVKEYYNNGLTPSMVFNHIWQQDAGNFYAM